MKKILVPLILCLCLCFSTVAFATEKVQQRNTMSYESRWFNDAADGSFTIYNENNGKVGVTIKIESSDQNAYCLVQLYKENGEKVMPSAVSLSPTGRVEYVNTFNLTPGTYKVACLGYSNSGMRVMCWMY